MKSIFIACLVSLLVYAEARAEWVSQREYPRLSAYISEGTYQSTRSFAVDTLGSVVKSTSPSILYSVIVGSASNSKTSFIEVFDARQSTGGAKQIIRIDPGTWTNTPLNAYCSSGIAVSNQGVPPSDITILYRFQ